MSSHRGRADSHPLQVIHRLGIIKSYNLTSIDPNYSFKLAFVEQ